MLPEDISEPLTTGKFALKIPNTEIQGLFQKSVKEWFFIKTESSDRSELFTALWNGDIEQL